MSARDDILRRIRAARLDVPAGEQRGTAAVPRGYQRAREIPEGLVERFCERVADYRAEVRRVAAAQAADAVGAALTALGATRVGVAAGLPAPWRPLSAPPDLDVVVDGTDGVDGTNGTESTGGLLDLTALQGLDAVVTAAAVGIAETGTVVLDGGPGCGRRALTLVPDAHVCLVRIEDIVDDVPAAVARLRPDRPLTWISGPSATSDIELHRVEGVHGPRRLHVLVVDT